MKRTLEVLCTASLMCRIACILILLIIITFSHQYIYFKLHLQIFDVKFNISFDFVMIIIN